MAVMRKSEEFKIDMEDRVRNLWMRSHFSSHCFLFWVLYFQMPMYFIQDKLAPDLGESPCNRAPAWAGICSIMFLAYIFSPSMRPSNLAAHLALLLPHLMPRYRPSQSAGVSISPDRRSLKKVENVELMRMSRDSMPNPIHYFSQRCPKFEMGR
jgi:hypothetical protein